MITPEQLEELCAAHAAINRALLTPAQRRQADLLEALRDCINGEACYLRAASFLTPIVTYSAS